MAPNTAVGFLLAGDHAPGHARRRPALVAESDRRGRRPGSSRDWSDSGWPSIVLAIDLGVHGWFFKVPTERLGLAPVGKMALFTALTFEAASLAALAHRARPATAGSRLGGTPEPGGHGVGPGL